MPISEINDRPKNTIIFGFDSAWTDKNPGAICSLSFGIDAQVSFATPCQVKFREALNHIEKRKSEFARAVVAIDQPTLVPNETGMRPAERVAASVMSYTGGGVQPANFGKKQSMFGPEAPIWCFKRQLGADDNPHEARQSEDGLFLMEVFPALALTGLHRSFSGRLCAPKYNPRSKKFRICDWNKVIDVLTSTAKRLKLEECAEWCSGMRCRAKPSKGSQDKVDAVICALIGYIWLRNRETNSMMLGDLETGYIVTPVSHETEVRLTDAAKKRKVPIWPLAATTLAGD